MIRLGVVLGDVTWEYFILQITCILDFFNLFAFTKNQLSRFPIKLEKQTHTKDNYFIAYNIMGTRIVNK